jgi:hypothetical protein
MSADTTVSDEIRAILISNRSLGDITSISLRNAL